MLRVRTAVLAAAALAAVAGCSREERTEFPAACRTGPEAVLAALEAAPGRVRIAETPISGCFVRESDASEVQVIGQVVVDAAVPLAERAKEEPEGEDALRLGYLSGAARRGAARTQGIHDEILRRLDQELVGVDTGARAFTRGERAGRAGG